jgi:hypothetical protein
MKKAVGFALVLGALSLLVQPACTSLTPEELKNSIQVTDMQSKWVSKFYQPWPPRLILVPEISFRIKDVGSQPLSYVTFNAVFNFKGERDNFGDCFLAAIGGKAVLPGGASQVITMKSNFGVDGKDLANIRDNPAWKQAEVRLFVQSKGTQPVLLGVYDVSRYIDFKEPEAPQLKKSDIKK